MTPSTSRSRREAKRDGIRRRPLLLVFATLLVLLVTPLSASSTPRIYAFVNADMRAQALEKELKSHLSGVDVTVFSRINGFEAALKERPEGVLARKSVLDALGLRAELQGYLGDRATERYVLLSANTAITPDQLGGKTLGVVDILGRRRMEAFVSEVLGGPAPRLKYVTHERDLLALLQFDAAAAVLTSEAWAQVFRDKSEMNLKLTPLKNEVGLPALSFSSAAGKSAIEGKVRGAGRAFNELLGVTQWR